MTAKNEELLHRIEAILNATKTEDTLHLNSHQIEMLMLSERDIENKNLISESDLRKADALWLS
jgi:hypothetical protein